jgi:glutathione S-transferase
MRTLYHWPLCGASRSTRILLGEKKLEHTLIVEPYWKKREEFCELNPRSKVPVLVEENGLTLCESSVICEYLEEAYPTQVDFMGASPAQRAQTRSLRSLFEVDFFWDVSQKIVFEKTLKRHFGLGPLDSKVVREGVKKLHEYMEYLSWLVSRRHWLAGENFSVADMVGAGYLSALDYLGHVPWETYPEMKDWYARLKSRPSMRPLLEDRVPGMSPIPHYADPDF